MRSQLKKIEDLGAAMEEALILDNKYTEHSTVGLAQQWDQLDQLGMRMQHNLEQQIQARYVFFDHLGRETTISISRGKRAGGRVSKSVQTKHCSGRINFFHLLFYVLSRWISMFIFFYLDCCFEKVIVTASHGDFSVK